MRLLSIIANPLACMRLLIGYFIAYFSFFPWIHRQRAKRRVDPDCLQPEARLYCLLFSESLMANLEKLAHACL